MKKYIDSTHSLLFKIQSFIFYNFPIESNLCNYLISLWIFFFQINDLFHLYFPHIYVQSSNILL